MGAGHDTEKMAVVSRPKSSGKIRSDQDEPGGLRHQGGSLSMEKRPECGRNALFVLMAQTGR